MLCATVITVVPVVVQRSAPLDFHIDSWTTIRPATINTNTRGEILFNFFLFAFPSESERFFLVYVDYASTSCVLANAIYKTWAMLYTLDATEITAMQRSALLL